MAEQRHKYPRTFHVPWSPGATADDKILTTTAHFEGKEVIVSEKLDGENCTIGQSYTHARSTSSRHHPSRAWVKGLQAQIGHEIPEGWRLCGENLYARHSLAYEDLPSYFLLFSIWDANNTCLSWDETAEWAKLLDLMLVPVLYRGPWDEDKISKIWDGRSKYGPEGEGYVVRVAASFPYDKFAESVAKFVRPHHVQTDANWMQSEVVPNRLRPSPEVGVTPEDQQKIEAFERWIGDRTFPHPLPKTHPRRRKDHLTLHGLKQLTRSDDPVVARMGKEVIQQLWREFEGRKRASRVASRWLRCFLRATCGSD